MMHRVAIAICLAGAAAANADEPPRVVVDIAPLHALVASVTDGLTEPDLLLPPGASPHDFAFRPSDARALGTADVVFWVGEALTPELARPLATLAPDARRVEMLETDGWTALPYRAEVGTRGEADGHAHVDHVHDGGTDPHAWMDPRVARAWLETIAAALASADPERAELYRQNAGAASAEIAALEAEIAERLAPVADVPFLLPHDALQYFGARFDLSPVGALMEGDGTPPGPARIARLRDRVAERDIVCVLSDPKTDAGWIDLVTEGSDVRTAQVDPEGVNLAPGAGLYAELLRRTADAVAGCLGAE